MMHKRITQQFTWTGQFANAALFLLLLIFVTQAKMMSFVTGVGVALLVLTIAIAVINDRNIKKRNGLVEAYAQKHGLHFESGGQFSHGLSVIGGLGAIDDLSNVKDKQIRNIVKGPDWTYSDFSYGVYARTRGGSYKRASVYYGVMSAQLPRALPNVFFDSKKARRRQFRFHFRASQKHSLEGDFDRYFVTYFPENYKVDSLSFISPDVMLALREAADYDIEIVGDRLFLYGPLYEPEVQINDMANKLQKIKKELLDNILTYRDERLPFAAGRREVAPEGASLKRSYTWQIVGAVIVAVYVLYAIFS